MEDFFDEASIFNWIHLSVLKLNAVEKICDFAAPTFDKTLKRIIEIPFMTNCLYYRNF